MIVPDHLIPPGGSMSARLLIVDDQVPILQFLARTLEDQAYEVSTATTLSQCRTMIPEVVPDLVLLDMLLPDGNGLDLLVELRREYPHMAVILMTAYGEIETAVQAIRAGAHDFITKPFNLEQLLLSIERVLGNTRTARQLYTRHRRGQYFHVTPGIVMSTAPSMEKIYDTVRRLASGDATSVLIEGESGVGKDVLANLIHSSSPRSGEAFLELNCGALPEKLLESELFGHEAGSFTGAVQAKPGLMELAHRGSLFLDEIGEMSLPLQVKLLRVLERQSFRRVGGVTDVTVDVRVISATNRDLAAMVRAGDFREDLYYRLNVVPIRVPSLRERPEDILPLAEHFLAVFNLQFSKHIGRFSDSAQAALSEYSWPGNIREVRNVVERAVLLGDGDILRRDDLALDPRAVSTSVASDGLPVDLEWTEDGVDLETIVSGIEEALIRRAYKASGRNKSRAARLLGLNRDKFRTRFDKYDIS